MGTPTGARSRARWILPEAPEPGCSATVNPAFTHPGATGLKDRKTIVLAYSLNIDAAEQKAIVKPRQ